MRRRVRDDRLDWGGQRTCDREAAGTGDERGDDGREFGSEEGTHSGGPPIRWGRGRCTGDERGEGFAHHRRLRAVRGAYVAEKLAEHGIGVATEPGEQGF